MNKRGAILFSLSALITIALIVLIICSEANNWPGVASVISSILGALWSSLALAFLRLFNQPWVFSLNSLLFRKKLSSADLVRCSFAYLYRIKIEGKYLLIKNHRGIGRFQPVGGVYKMSKEELIYIKSKYFATTENGINEDNVSKLDYRVKVPAKRLPSFVKRFIKKADRERIDNLGREFREELIEPELINRDVFSAIKYRYCGTHFDGIVYDPYFGCYTLRIFDIVELELSERQAKAFETLSQGKSQKLLFASAAQISSRGICPEQGNLNDIITDHSAYITEDFGQNLVPCYKREAFEISL